MAEISLLWSSLAEEQQTLLMAAAVVVIVTGVQFLRDRSKK